VRHLPHPAGRLEYDVSIKARMWSVASSQNPGYIVNLTKVENGSAGKKPTITFTMKDAKGRGLTLADLPTTARNRLAATMAGPTIDYGYTSFGSDVTTPGYVTEDLISAANPANAAKCAADGTCTYTFLHAIPADAKGATRSDWKAAATSPSTPAPRSRLLAEFTMQGKVAMDFSVDGSPVALAGRSWISPSATTATGTCVARRQPQPHRAVRAVPGPSQTDWARRPIATVQGERSSRRRPSTWP
jgi:hypothetical protein